MIGTGGDLVESGGVELEIRFDVVVRFRIEVVFVVPVAHNNGFGRPFVEVFVVPSVVRPNPRTNSVFLALLDKEEEIVFPELALAQNDIVERLLVSIRLFVVPEMEESGAIEDFRYLLDEVGADFVVGRGREHLGVLAEPVVVAGGEIQLGNRLEPEFAHSIQVFAQALDRPRALDGDFRMGFVLDRFSKVDDDLG